MKHPVSQSLHTKSVTADRSISMFGTVNLDMRSLWLNYEVSLFIYGTAFGEHLQSLQQSSFPSFMRHARRRVLSRRDDS